MADLVKSEDDISRRIEARHTGALMGIDLNPACVGAIRSQRHRKARMNHGAKRRIDAFEFKVAAVHPDPQTLADQNEITGGTIDRDDADCGKALTLVLGKTMRTIAGDQGYVG